MRDFTPDESAAATQLDQKIAGDATARAILDFLIANTGERATSATIADRLGLPEHRDVARATYRMGEICSTLGFKRPWGEAQQGYLMTGEVAELFRRARETALTP